MGEKINARLREIALSRDRSVVNVARKLKMARPNVSRILNGRANISLEFAWRFEMLYGTPMAEIMRAQLEEALKEFVELKQV